MNVWDEMFESLDGLNKIFIPSSFRIGISLYCMKNFVFCSSSQYSGIATRSSKVLSETILPSTSKKRV